MTRTAVLARVLQLPPDERADVAKRLIASLDEPADGDVEAAWLAEVERRLQDVDRGTAKLEPCSPCPRSGLLDWQPQQTTWMRPPADSHPARADSPRGAPGLRPAQRAGRTAAWPSPT